MGTFVFDARTANAHYPGIGRYTFELARALAALTDLTLIVNPLQSAPEFDLWALPARRVAVPHTPRSLAQQWSVPARLRRLRARGYHSPFYLMPYAPGTPTVVTVYDTIPFLAPDGYSAAQRLIYRAAHQLAFWTAGRVVTLCQAARAEFLQRFPLAPDRITVVAPGLPAHFAPPAAEAVARYRAAQQLPTDYLLFVGSNKPHKNLPALIQAYGTLPTSAPALVIAGPEDPRYPAMRAAAASLGDRVRFLGRVPDEALPLLYAGARLYLQPALVEGFGFPVLEAMGCGTPVACANIPVLRELAQNAAVYFDPRDPATIARALVEALDSPSTLTALRERGLLRAREYNWPRAAAQTLSVYRALAGGA